MKHWVAVLSLILILSLGIAASAFAQGSGTMIIKRGDQETTYSGTTEQLGAMFNELFRKPPPIYEQMGWNWNPEFHNPLNMLRSGIGVPAWDTQGNPITIHYDGWWTMRPLGDGFTLVKYHWPGGLLNDITTEEYWSGNRFLVSFTWETYHQGSFGVTGNRMRDELGRMWVYRPQGSPAWPGRVIYWGRYPVWPGTPVWPQDKPFPGNLMYWAPALPSGNVGGRHPDWWGSRSAP